MHANLISHWFYNSKFIIRMKRINIFGVFIILSLLLLYERIELHRDSRNSVNYIALIMQVESKILTSISWFIRTYTLRERNSEEWNDPSGEFSAERRRISVGARVSVCIESYGIIWSRIQVLSEKIRRRQDMNFRYGEIFYLPFGISLCRDFRSRCGIFFR